jgi:hypothetical protein
MEHEFHETMLQALTSHLETARFHSWLGVFTLRWRSTGPVIGTAPPLADRIWSERHDRSLPAAIDQIAGSMPEHRFGAWSEDLRGIAVVSPGPHWWTWHKIWQHSAVAAMDDGTQYRIGWRAEGPVPFSATIAEPDTAIGWWPPGHRRATRTGAATARLLAAICAGEER